jgi:hypothetical protein
MLEQRAEKLIIKLKGLIEQGGIDKAGLVDLEKEIGVLTTSEPSPPISWLNRLETQVGLLIDSLDAPFDSTNRIKSKESFSLIRVLKLMVKIRVCIHAQKKSENSCKNVLVTLGYWVHLGIKLFKEDSKQAKSAENFVMFLTDSTELYMRFEGLNVDIYKEKNENIDVTQTLKDIMSLNRGSSSEYEFLSRESTETRFCCMMNCLSFNSREITNLWLKLMKYMIEGIAKSRDLECWNLQVLGNGTDPIPPETIERVKSLDKLDDCLVVSYVFYFVIWKNYTEGLSSSEISKLLLERIDSKAFISKRPLMKQIMQVICTDSGVMNRIELVEDLKGGNFARLLKYKQSLNLNDPADLFFDFLIDLLRMDLDQHDTSIKYKLLCKKIASPVFKAKLLTMENLRKMKDLMGASHLGVFIVCLVGYLDTASGSWEGPVEEADLQASILMLFECFALYFDNLRDCLDATCGGQAKGRDRLDCIMKEIEGLTDDDQKETEGSLSAVLGKSKVDELKFLLELANFQKIEAQFENLKPVKDKRSCEVCFEAVRCYYWGFQFLSALGESVQADTMLTLFFKRVGTATACEGLQEYFEINEKTGVLFSEIVGNSLRLADATQQSRLLAFVELLSQPAPADSLVCSAWKKLIRLQMVLAGGQASSMEAAEVRQILLLLPFPRVHQLLSPYLAEPSLYYIFFFRVLELLLQDFETIKHEKAVEEGLSTLQLMVVTFQDSRASRAIDPFHYEILCSKCLPLCMSARSSKIDLQGHRHLFDCISADLFNSYQERLELAKSSDHCAMYSLLRTALLYALFPLIGTTEDAGRPAAQANEQGHWLPCWAIDCLRRRPSLSSNTDLILESFVYHSVRFASDAVLRDSEAAGELADCLLRELLEQSKEVWNEEARLGQHAITYVQALYCKFFLHGACRKAQSTQLIEVELCKL